jgi:hypothetical protein
MKKIVKNNRTKKWHETALVSQQFFQDFLEGLGGWGGLTQFQELCSTVNKQQLWNANVKL